MEKLNKPSPVHQGIKNGAVEVIAKDPLGNKKSLLYSQCLGKITGLDTTNPKHIKIFCDVDFQFQQQTKPFTEGDLEKRDTTQ